MKRRRKTITAGLLVKVVEYIPAMPHDTSQQRAARQKATTAAQRRLNFRTAQGRLEALLAANFTWKDYFVTLTYEPGKEPRNRAEAKRHERKYLRRIRAQRKRRGQALKWICSIENKHGEGRYHLHAIMSAADASRDSDEFRSLWPYGHVDVKKLFDKDHREDKWLDVARYMTKERPEDGKDETPVGAQIYSCSRNLVKPTSRTEWIEEGTPLDLPANAFVLEREITENEFSRYKYYKYLTGPLFPAT